MRFNTKMVFLGFIPKKSTKTDSVYFMAKLMDKEEAEVFEFYVPGNETDICMSLGKAKMFDEIGVTIGIKVFKGNKEVVLAGVQN